MQAPLSRTAFGLLREQAAFRPDHPAVIADGMSYTYAELYRRAAAVASRMTEEGLRRHDRIGLLANNRIEWLEVFFGGAAIGVETAPFSTWSTIPELQFLLNDSEAETLFTLSHYGDKAFGAEVRELVDNFNLLYLQEVIEIDLPSFDAYRQAAGDPDLPPGASASAGDILTVLYTSGSSSKPKCVPLTHYAAIENGFNIGERQGLSPDDKVLVSIPLFWSYGAVNALMATVSHGATLVLQDRFEAGGALDLIEGHGCTSIYTLPTMTNALLAHPEFRPERTSSLRTGVTIGAPQDVIRAAEELGASEICNIYGQTESYGNCCVTPHDWPLDKRANCQGPPLPGVELRIRDTASDAILGVGEVGEIEVAGYLTAGYAGASALHNRQSFTDDGYFRTGDLGSLNADGTIIYAGRQSEMIKRSGINVSPSEIEDALQKSDDVGIAGVAGVPDPIKGEIIVAFIVPRPGAPRSESALNAHCRSLLSSYKVPDRIFFREALPLTATGKLMRRELADLAKEAALTEDAL